MAKIFIGNNNIGGGGIVPTNTLPTANQENYNKHELYLNDGELKYIDYSNSTYDYKTLASSDLVTTISFTIDTTTYQAEDGMTWEEWVSSVYNTGGWKVLSNNTRVLNSALTNYIAFGGSEVNKTEEIVANRTYSVVIGGGGGDN